MIHLLMVLAATNEAQHYFKLLESNGYHVSLLNSWDELSGAECPLGTVVFICDEHSLPPLSVNLFQYFQNIPLLCLSENDSNEAIALAKTHGVWDFLLQPVSDRQLLASVQLAAARLPVPMTSASHWQGLENLLATNLDGIVIHDSQMRILFQNAAHRQLFGDQRNQLCFEAIQRRSDVCNECPVVAAFKTGQVHSIERSRIFDGREHHFEVVASPIPNPAGGVAVVMEIVRDVTLRKEAEKAVAHRQAFESLIARISSKFVELDAADFSTGIHFALSELGRFSGVDRCTLYLLGANWNILIRAYVWSEQDGRVAADNQHFELHNVRWLMEQMGRREVVNLSDLSELPPEVAEERHFFDSVGLTSLVAVPVTAQSRLAGILCVGTSGSVKSWDSSDIELLQTVGEIVGNALDRALALQVLHTALDDLATAKEKTDSILKSVSDGIIVTDQKGFIVNLNKPACRLLGFKAIQDAMGQPLDGVITHQDFVEQMAGMLQGEERDSLVMDLSSCASDEMNWICQARSSVVRNRRGEKTGVVTILQDVTRARELERMKTHFVSTAAHELRTPLTSIIGYAEFLLKPEFLNEFGEERQREFLEVIMEQGESLSRIVDDLLDVSRIEAGRAIPLDKGPCNLAEKIRRIVQHYQLQSGRHRFVIQTAGDLPSEFELDCHKVGQVLENLYSNAVKYSPRGGLILTRLERQGDVLRVMIEDEGVGMTTEQVERVFDKFFRADDLSQHAIRGLGLGMNIVRHIVENHGGNIWVESEPGKGTRVYFTLPLSSDSQS